LAKVFLDGKRSGWMADALSGKAMAVDAALQHKLGCQAPSNRCCRFAISPARDAMVTVLVRQFAIAERIAPDFAIDA
jgi:hypothetical protein